MAPFFGPVKATVSGTPGSGAITPSTASAGYLAFSAIPSNLILFCRADDASNAWMTFYTLWNGTTLSAPVFVDSSSGSQLSLTSAAVISVVPDPNRVQPHIGGGKWGLTTTTPGGSTSNLGLDNGVGYGSAGTASIASTTYLSMQHRQQFTSATTASATAGRRTGGSVYIGSAAFKGGFEFIARWGASALPTAPRFFSGLTAQTTITTQEPDAMNNTVGFGMTSTDTTLQFITKAAGAANKINTGITPAVNDFFETAVWCPPGSSTCYGLITRLNDGAMFYTSTSTATPTANTLLDLNVMGGLNATNTGTAMVFHFQSMYLRSSF